MPTPLDAKTKTSRTYNSAADHYDDEANSFWSRFGRRTIERLELKAGDKVLDVCSGTGASAIPAAEAVGPTGSVVAVDLAEELLKLARSKADQQGLQNIEFRVCDMLELGTGDHELDAVVCVFGIFFVPDMERAVRKLWQLVRPGGKLAITTWGQNFFEPASSVFWNSIREMRPDLYKGFNPGIGFVIQTRCVRCLPRRARKMSQWITRPTLTVFKHLSRGGLRFLVLATEEQLISLMRRNLNR